MDFNKFSCNDLSLNLELLTLSSVLFLILFSILNPKIVFSFSKFSAGVEFFSFKPEATNLAVEDIAFAVLAIFCPLTFNDSGVDLKH